MRPLLLLATSAVAFLATSPLYAEAPTSTTLTTLDSDAAELSRVHSVVVAYDGEIIHEHHQGGPGVASPANIKSLSKTVLAAITGAAIERVSLSQRTNPWWSCLANISLAVLTQR